MIPRAGAVEACKAPHKPHGPGERAGPVDAGTCWLPRKAATEALLRMAKAPLAKEPDQKVQQRTWKRVSGAASGSRSCGWEGDS